MHTFNVNLTNMVLGAKAITVENIEKHRADYSDVLDRGVILTSVTATVTGASTVVDEEMARDRKSIVWFIHASDEPEEIELTITVTTNDGQTLTNKVRYVIVE